MCIVTSAASVTVALDFGNVTAARALVSRLPAGQCGLKVGKELFLAGGPSLVRDWVNEGRPVFLDLKFHDIPNTVAAAVRQAAELGVWMVNVHALGGGAMLSAARRALDEYHRPPLLTAVTVLTSHDAASLDDIGVRGPPEAAVERLAALAFANGLDGIVCSPQEAERIRVRFGEGFRRVTPGIRSPDDAADDQQRVMTPQEAVQAGASDLVVGRPITQAHDPAAAVASLRANAGL